ncbi:VOC family protein [Nocardioides acrostichi]|uniref:VOC family protein n=1 Tax=Nocardioides acrostichi TaxID=2784339 RepID=A0A930YBV8_9ACTN|nr:VOC family protein [Nocardioides acrostichi]MBF4162878.1 VOC family protein [Nocardioides acrostichi]
MPVSAATRPFWVSAFLDLAGEHWDRGVSFWAQVTGYGLSGLRGEQREFGTLVPAEGDDHLRVQRLGEGHTGVHLDLHVADPQAAATAAERLGATVVADHGYVVSTSPGGFTFCFVTQPGLVKAVPAAWPGGHTSVLDQVCLDVPGRDFDEEVAFWAALTGWRVGTSGVSPDFVPLDQPPGQPVRLLVQRRAESGPGDAVTGHVDLAASDRVREVERHVALGAHVVGEHSRWTVLRGPAGSTYCITDRDPVSGRLST